MGSFHSTNVNLGWTRGPEASGWTTARLAAGLWLHWCPAQPAARGHQNLVKSCGSQTPASDTYERHHAYGSGDDILLSVTRGPSNRPCRLFVWGIPAGIPTVGKQEVATQETSSPRLDQNQGQVVSTTGDPRPASVPETHIPQLSLGPHTGGPAEVQVGRAPSHRHLARISALCPQTPPLLHFVFQNPQNNPHKEESSVYSTTENGLKQILPKAALFEKL